MECINSKLTHSLKSAIIKDMDDVATALKQELKQNKKLRARTKKALEEWANGDGTDLYDENGNRKAGHFLSKAEENLE